MLHACVLVYCTVNVKCLNLYIHTMDKQYNLRSTKRDSIEIPVQMLCSDFEFSSKIGGFSNIKQSQFASSEDSDLGSELDCSRLMESDDDSKTSKLTSKTTLSGLDQASTSQVMDGNVQVSMNQEILNQLKKMGQRLDVLEKGKVGKPKIIQKSNLP